MEKKKSYRWGVSWAWAFWSASHLSSFPTPHGFLTLHPSCFSNGQPSNTSTHFFFSSICFALTLMIAARCSLNNLLPTTSFPCYLPLFDPSLSSVVGSFWSLPCYDNSLTMPWRPHCVSVSVPLAARAAIHPGRLSRRERGCAGCCPLCRCVVSRVPL